MLTIKRKPRESFQIGDDITVTVDKINGQVAQISIQAPKDVKILRDDAKIKK